MVDQPRFDFMPIVEPKKLSMSDTLNGAFRMLNVVPQVVLGAAGISAGMTLLMQLWSQVQVMPDLEKQLSLARVFPSDAWRILSDWLTAHIAFWLVTLLVSAFLGLMLPGAITWATGRACLGQATTLSQGLRQGLKRWPALFVQSLIAGIPMILVMVLSFGSLFAGQGSDYNRAMSMIGLALILMVPTFLWVASLMMTPAAIMLEEVGPLKGIKRSWQLLRGGFGRVLGRFFLIMLIMAPVALLIGILGQIAVIGVVLTGLVMPLLALWQTAMYTLVYIDRRIAEGGLAEHIAAAVIVDPAPQDNLQL